MAPTKMPFPDKRTNGPSDDVRYRKEFIDWVLMIGKGIGVPTAFGFCSCPGIQADVVAHQVVMDAKVAIENPLRLKQH
jgi:hypothetical protein